MRSVLTRAVVLVVTALCLLAAGADVASAGEPIHPNQHFLGLVNTSHTIAVVYTVCPGPATPGRTGAVAGGQSLAVARIRSGGGDTGPFSQVYGWFVPTAAVNRPVQLNFTTYHAQKAIPLGVRVPCDGKGRVEFSSCPYLAPCAYGWTPNYVKVQFVNIAAQHIPHTGTNTTI